MTKMKMSLPLHLNGFTTANGDLASVVDLDFGMGIEVLK